MILDFARHVGSVEILKKLYVMTFADMRAVAPKVWNNWRDLLLGELYMRTLEYFEKGELAEEAREARVERVRERLRRALPEREGGRRAALETVLATMPESYFLSTPEQSVPHHAELLRELREGGGSFVSSVRHFRDREFSEFTICAADRPGLFSMIAGVLAAHGMNILAARITTTHDGAALDAFRISHEESDVALDAERWERVDATLRGVLGGEVDVEELVRRSRRPSILARARRRVATTVEIDNRVSRGYTVLDVYTGDRVGLLFTITNCLYHLWLEIHLAKINTLVDQVLDVFYVTDNEGRKIEDAARLETIRRELTRALEVEVAPEAVRAAGA